MDYDFSRLTPEQEWLICYQGWRVGQKRPDGSLWPQPSKRTVTKLLKRGLMIGYQTSVADPYMGIPMEVTEYHVPIPVHFAWCLSHHRPN